VLGCGFSCCLILVSVNAVCVMVRALYKAVVMGCADGAVVMGCADGAVVMVLW